MAFETTKVVKYQLAVSGDDKLRSALSGVGGALRGMNREANFATQAFAGLVGAASIGEFTKMINDVVEAKARLYDLGLQTGISVEALGGLSRVAMRSGTSIDDVAAASNKLHKALATNNEDSRGAAQAIKALGLNFDQFKALGADQQLVAVAKAMEEFGNVTGGKTAGAMLLLGKSGATLLPFLKELAERGIMATKETTASALAAKEYQDNLVALREAGDAWKRSIVTDMLPAMTALTKEMAEAKNASSRLGITLRYLGDNNHFSDIDLQRKALERLNLQISFTSALYADMLGAQASEPYNRAYAQRVAELRTQLDLQRKAAADASTALKAHANLLLGAGLAGGGRGFVNPAGITPPELDIKPPGEPVRDGYESIINKIREKIAVDRAELDLGRELTAIERFQAEVYADVDKNFSKLTLSKMLGIDAELQWAVAQGKSREQLERNIKFQDEAAKDIERTIELQSKHVSQIDDEVTALQRTYDEYGMSAEAIERNAIARVRDAAALVLQRRGVEDFNPAQAEMNRQLEREAKLLGNTADLRAAIAKKKARDRDDPLTGAKNAVQAYLDDVSAAGLNTQRVVGNTLKNVEDGMVQFFTTGKFGARQFIDTLLAEFLRLRVVQPMMAELLGGSFFSSLLGGSSSSSGLAAIGNMGAAFLIPGLATGGPVRSGSPYLVGERGPELFVPQVAGAIVPNGAMGGGQRVMVNTSNVFNIDARTDRAQIIQLVTQGVSAGNQQLVATLHAQGAL